MKDKKITERLAREEQRMEITTDPELIELEDEELEKENAILEYVDEKLEDLLDSQDTTLSEMLTIEEKERIIKELAADQAIMEQEEKELQEELAADQAILDKEASAALRERTY